MSSRGLRNARLRIRADDLTIAYVAIGAYKAAEAARDRFPSDRFEGELGYIQRVIDQALVLDTTADIVEWEDGVFVYDIAETFGEEYGKALIDDTKESVESIITRVFEGA